MAALHAQCFTVPRPWQADEFREMLALPENFALDLPDGFLIGRILGPEAELLTLAVAPKARRKGVARRLLDSLKSHVMAAGVTELFLEVATTNSAAIALYQKSGFRDAGLRKDYYNGVNGEKVAALVMVSDLSTT